MKAVRTFIYSVLLSTVSAPAIPKNFTEEEIVKYNVEIIAKMIQIVEPRLKEEKRNQIANALYESSKQFAIDPKIMVAIISTESNFNNAAVSSTGDLSLAQINTKVWDAEFKRLGLAQIDTKLLQADEAYALYKMGKILSILKARHANKDVMWYAIYHSKTKKHKAAYNDKVQTRLRKIASVSL